MDRLKCKKYKGKKFYESDEIKKKLPVMEIRMLCFEVNIVILDEVRIDDIRDYQQDQAV